MKRVLVIIAAIGIVAAGGWMAMQVLLERSSASATPELLATVPAPCPTQNDLAGIEGYAPGAGQAERGGNQGAGMFGAFGGAAAGSTPAPTPQAHKLECRTLAPATEQYFQNIAQAQANLPSLTIDVPSLAQSIGSDPHALFAYVRDAIRTDPYPGTMRGIFGTMQSGAGSPADKAALLGELLQARQVPVQFVHAPLSGPEIDRVIAAAQQPGRQTAVGAQPPASASPDEATVAEMQSFAKSYDEYVDTQFDDALRRARESTDALLAKSAVRLANDDGAARAVLAGNLRDHWWVRAQIDGAWTDLDPTLPDAQPGSHLGAAPADDPVNTLPADLQTQVSMRLVATFADGSTSVLVEKTGTTSDLYDRAIKIGFDNDATRASLGTTTRFTPYIEIGGDRSSGDALATDAQTPGLTQVRLDVTTAIPGRSPYTLSRAMYDKTAGDNPSYALQTIYYGLIVPGEPGTDLAMHREAEGAAAVHAMLAYAAAHAGPGGGLPAAAAMPYPIPAMRYLGMDERARALLERSGGVRFFLDRPQIVFYQHGFLPGTSGPRLIEALDVLDNGAEAIGGANAVRANVTRGYIDDQIERSVIGDSGAVITASITDAPQTSVRAIRTGADAAALSINPNVRTIMLATIGSGVAIAPPSPITVGGTPHFGWWALDPATGNMLGYLESGGGQSLTEYNTTLNQALKEARDVQFIGSCIACAWNNVPLTTKAGNSMAKCIGQAACTYLVGMWVGKTLQSYQLFDLALGYSVLRRLGWQFGGPNRFGGSLGCKAYASAF